MDSQFVDKIKQSIEQSFKRNAVNQVKMQITLVGIQIEGLQKQLFDLKHIRCTCNDGQIKTAIADGTFNISTCPECDGTGYLSGERPS